MTSNHDDHGDHAHGHDDHAHGAAAGGHDDHAHGGGHGGGHAPGGGHAHGGGHGGHDDHHAHHEYSAADYLLWAFGLLAALCVGVWTVGYVSGTPPGSNSAWLTIPSAAGILLVLPLIAFVVQMFFGYYMGRASHWVSLSAIFGACVLGTWIFVAMLRGEPGTALVHSQLPWFKIGDPARGGTQLFFGFYIDGLTAGMLFIVTFIGGLVHTYSTSYMDGDPRYHRFFGYLSIFCFSMLGLVLSDNLLGLYCFWELVGLSSYLLIGFWFEKVSAANACKKAFLVNRVGDIGFFFGLAAIFKWTGVLGYTEIFRALPEQLANNPLLSQPFHPFGLTFANCLPSPITIAGILLFCGAIGKSAQFPLHIWLPDAMEGPTPVSALIHAATMVAAGVFMVARLYPIFSPAALTFIAYTGLITACFAGTIAIAQYDIKRVLAYSTVSQLGYMVASLGVGGYTAGLFHLSTHAFFKALLFLCSGAVIHAVHTQDMREMGGLARKIPWTCAAMTIGTLAICGIPFTSGFYSKDAILEAMWDYKEAAPQHWPIFWLALLAAGVTSFYSFRLVIMTFLGEPRDRAKFDSAHESPPAMIAPLILLSVLSIVSAYGFVHEGPREEAWATVAPHDGAASTGEAHTRGEIAGHMYGLQLATNWGPWFPGVNQRPDKLAYPGMPVVQFFENHGRDWPGNGKGIGHYASPNNASANGASAAGEHAGAEEGEGHEAAHGQEAAHGHEAATEHGGAPHSGAHHPSEMPGWLPIVVVFSAIAFSFVCFYAKLVTIELFEENAPPAGRALRFVQRVLENKYYIDELYVLIFIRPFLFLNQCLWTFDATVVDGIVNGVGAMGRHLSAITGRFDLYVVDGLANGLATVTTEIGNRIRHSQTGVVQNYLVISFWIAVLGLIGIQLMSGS